MRAARQAGATPRALLLGVLCTAVTVLWIHYAELVMSGFQGHSAIAATSTPVGAVSLVAVVAAVNLLARRLLPDSALTPAEILVVYTMITTSACLSSSGQLHFLVPTVVAAFHYATDANGWAGAFHRFVPRWMAQTDPDALRGFYEGRTRPPWDAWAVQIAVWGGFLLAFAFATLCVAALLRRLWVDRERLAFPTVALPLALAEEGAPLLRQPLFWAGATGPLLLSLVNTLALNDPRFPLLSLRADTVDLARFFPDPPFSAIGNTPLSFYPFVVGVAYFIPVDVTFSAWFFFLLTRVERVVGAWLNIDTGMTGAPRAAFPFLGQQGAGAFLALALVPLWLSRGYLREVVRTALREPGGIDDRDEAMSSRTALTGLAVSVALMIGFCVAGGMQPLIATALALLALCFAVAATRIRAETGNAWLWGPEVDANHLLTRTLGTGLMTPSDLTVLAYVRPVLGNADMRCLPMPHQMEALKMADAVGLSRRRLVLALCVGAVFGLGVSFVVALSIWYGYGAEAKTDLWRTSMGRIPFDNLVALLRNPAPPDPRGIGAIAFGFAWTAALMLARNVLPWWPLHPVGYAMANTNTMTQTWMPFLIAWVLKSLALRYGGAGFYRRSLPFFLGLIAGDLLGGGVTTAVGAFTGINVYPINW